jgi:hypothetical protein
MSKFGLAIWGVLAVVGCGRTDIGPWSVELGDGGAGGRRAGGADSGAARAGGAGGGGTSALAGSGGVNARAGAGGVGGPAPAGASGAAGTACGALIDDMETGDGHICQGDGRQGVWYAFNDGAVGSTQWPAPTAPGTPIAVSASTLPGSRFALHTYGRGFSLWAGIGTDLDYDGATYRSYDARRFDGVTFWARSDLSNIVEVRLSTPTTTETQWGGSCPMEPCPMPLSFSFALTPAWTHYEVAFNDFGDSLYGPTLEVHALLNLQFSPRPAVDAFDFWIDDVSFYVAPRDCCDSLPVGCRGVLSFEDPNLSAVLRELTGASGDIHCEDMCNHPGFVAENRNIQSLAGMECLTLLTGIDLSHNPIADMTPLANLPNLYGVDLDYTALTRLPSLRGMGRLNSLGLDFSTVTDIGGALDAPSLKSLAVVGTKLDCAAQAQNLARLSTYATVFSDCP